MKCQNLHNSNNTFIDLNGLESVEWTKTARNHMSAFDTQKKNYNALFLCKLQLIYITVVPHLAEGFDSVMILTHFLKARVENLIYFRRIFE